eukprot:6175921-Pleurochrysis_carterae.AAC.3
MPAIACDTLLCSATLVSGASVHTVRKADIQQAAASARQWASSARLLRSQLLWRGHGPRLPLSAVLTTKAASGACAQDAGSRAVSLSAADELGSKQSFCARVSLVASFGIECMFMRGAYSACLVWCGVLARAGAVRCVRHAAARGEATDLAGGSARRKRGQRCGEAGWWSRVRRARGENVRSMQTEDGVWLANEAGWRLVGVIKEQRAYPAPCADVAWASLRVWILQVARAIVCKGRRRGDMNADEQINMRESSRW